MVDNNYLYRELFNNHCSIMLIIDADTGSIVEANKAAEKYYGYSQDELTGMKISDINILEDDEVKKEMSLALDQKRNYFNFRHLTADGSVKDVDVHSVPIKSGTGNLLFSIINDAQEEIRQKLMFDQLMLASPYAVIVFDKDQKIVNINKKFTEIFQYELPEIQGAFLNDILSPNSKKQIDKNFDLVYKGQIIKQDSKRRRKDGKLIDVEIIGYPITYRQNVIGAYALYIDISHRQKDSLTGLYNRNYFVEKIDKFIENFEFTYEIFSIIVIDIEGFKDINDTLGHIMGDKFLIEIADRLKLILNEKYVISRIDGDEFAILSSRTHRKDLVRLSNSILGTLSKSYIISNTEIYLNFKIGISTFPKDSMNSKDLIRFANIAMQHAKKESGSKISFYNNEISEEMEQKFFLANYLFRAISNKEFYILYQPIFNIKSKSMVGAEALLRWNSPLLGEVMPAEFIPIAEKTGLIITIGEWVIRQVCKQIKLWKEKGYNLVPISINISVNQLENVDFSDTIIDILERDGIDPALIELEITESVSSGDIKKITNNIKEFKKYGINISMDDFGTGFSSLGQLDIFELDKLKIDKVFIDDLVHGCKRQNLVRSIIAMAESLNLTTVAEGIETYEQLYELKGLGCQLGQGFLFSKPLLPLDIERIFKGAEIRL